MRVNVPCLLVSFLDFMVRSFGLQGELYCHSSSHIVRSAVLHSLYCTNEHRAARRDDVQCFSSQLEGKHESFFLKLLYVVDLKEKNSSFT